VAQDPRASDFANWIIYRLTDVMLMKAEAEVEMAGDVPEGATPTPEQLATYQDVFDIVMAVWRRANNKRTSTTDLLKFDDYATSRKAMEDLVLDERQRELMFEGKRWYDLVRRSRRDGNTNFLVGVVSRKGSSGGTAISSKLSRMDAIYWPYNNDEIKVNKNLVQNPAFSSGENDSYERTGK